MKYYVYSPWIGRTGSRRICSLLTDKVLPCTPWHIAQGKLQYIDGINVKEYETNIPQMLSELEDNTVVHSHSLILPLDTDNWTFILSKRNDRAQHLMSYGVAVIAGYNPEDKLESPIALDKEMILDMDRLMEKSYEEFDSEVDEYITIYLEDTVEEIADKLGVPLYENRDKDYVSNNDYSKIITNYNQIYKWLEK